MSKKGPERIFVMAIPTCVHTKFTESKYCVEGEFGSWVAGGEKKEKALRGKTLTPNSPPLSPILLLKMRGREQNK